jgi:carboxylesterase
VSTAAPRASDPPGPDPAATEAFYLPGTRPPPCLLIHGFTGMPFEMRHLGERLNAHGHAVLGVRLAGHGRTVEDLARTTWADWYRSAAEGCTRLAAAARQPVAAIGLSLGALLAVHLAHERPAEVRGLVLMGAALTLGDWRVRWLAPVLARVPPLRDRFRIIPKGGAGSDIRDPEARRAHPSYREVPLDGIVSLLELQRLVRAELPAVRQPALIVHGALDRTAPPAVAATLARRLGSTHRRTVILPESAHVVTVDRERDRVVAVVREFLAEIA